MELAFRVVQSSSILHGVHWGKFFLDTDCLLVVKAHLIEAYQLTQGEKPLYCMLEQILGFQVASSSKLTKENQDYLVLTSNGTIRIMEFINDYFRVSQSFSTQAENIEKIECHESKIICSDNQKNLFVLDYNLSSIIHKIEVKGSIIDWQIIGQSLLLLEYSTLEKNYTWATYKIQDGQKALIPAQQEFEEYLSCFLYFSGKVLVFTEQKVLIFAYGSCLNLIEIRTLKGFYSSSAVIDNKLYICVDDGNLYQFDEHLFEFDLKLQEDSLIFAINSSLFYISHHGQSGLLDKDSKQISRNYRSGSFIDGYLLEDLDSRNIQSFIGASVSFKTSEIIRVAKRCSDIYTQTVVSDISKYTTSAVQIEDNLFLLPFLKVVNIRTYELTPIETLGLIDQNTQFLMKYEDHLIQVTDKAIFYKGKLIQSFLEPCSSACGKDAVIVAGLANQDILILIDLNQKKILENIDFSAIALTEKNEILVGLQQTGVNKYSISGELLEKINTKGVPHSYLELFDRLYIGTRDGILEIISGQSKVTKKLGDSPLTLCNTQYGVIAVTSKNYLIYNKELDYKQLLIPESKFVISSDSLISVSKDLLFFDIEPDLRYSTSQEVLISIQGQINRMVKLNAAQLCFSYSEQGDTVLSILDIYSKSIKSVRSLKPIKSLISNESFIITGDSDNKLIFYSLNLEPIVSHSFSYEITALCQVENTLLVASSYLLFNLDISNIQSLSSIANTKFSNIISDIIIVDNYIVLALNSFGIFILDKGSLEVISASRNKHDFKKLLYHNHKIFAISINGWILTRSIEENDEKLCYCGSGARVILPGSLYYSNIAEVPRGNVILASLNGEILELYPCLEQKTRDKGREMFKELFERGIVDKSQTQELNLDILRLMLKLPELDSANPEVQELIQLSN